MFERRVMSCAGAAMAGAMMLGSAASGQMFPVSTLGYTRDIVVERTATAPWSAAAQAFDTFNGWAWYERGLAGTLGLPQGGAFTSVVDGTTLGQLQPYTANNALFLDATTTSGTLTLAPAAQTAYDALAIFASSSNATATWTGTMVITFTDASTSSAITFNAQDWFNVTTNNALNALGRANLNTSAVEATTASNPRIYQTTIDIVALGLSTRSVASIAFSVPGNTGQRNTVVMGVSGRRAVTQLIPVDATGWNRDIVVERTAVSPYSTAAASFDVGGNFAWFENGLTGTTKGLPQGGAFASLSNAAVHAQFQPYNANNALFLHATLTSPSGTLTLAPAAQVAYEFLAVFGSSSGGGGGGTAVVNFADGSSTGSIPFNAQDWYNVTTNNALNNLGRMNVGTNVLDETQPGNPRIYQSVIDLGALGFNNRAVQSITFTKPAAGTSTAIMAISGQPSSGAAGACCAFDGTCSAQALSACLAPSLFQGPGTACGAGSTCPVTTSACCNSTSGLCLFTSGTVCPSGYANQGTGSICSVNPCPQLGACCGATGGCSTTNFGGCAAPALFEGLGTVCDAGACPAIVSACCDNATGACTFVNGTACAATASNQGAGTSCAAGACPAIAQCCNSTNGACTLVYGGLCPSGSIQGGAGNSCAAGSNPCPPSGACCTGTGNQVCGQSLAASCSGAYSGDNTTCSPNNPCFPADDCGSTPLVATVGQSTLTGTTVGATTSISPTYTLCTNTTLTGATGGNDVWAKFIAPATAAYTMDLCGSSYDTVLTVYSACPGSDATLVGCNDDSTQNTACTVGGGTRSRIPTMTLASGNTYYIRIAGYANATGNYVLNIAYVDAGAPQACCVGAVCTLTDAANCVGGTYGPGTTCSPSPCGGPAGVCCRGATCSTAYASAAACEAATNSSSASVHSAFVVSASVCNTAPVPPATVGVATTPCCFADFNHNAATEVQDIFDFLNDWFAGKKIAIPSGDGDTGELQVQNIFDFLNLWFAGGCS